MSPAFSQREILAALRGRGSFWEWHIRGPTNSRSASSPWIWSAAISVFAHELPEAIALAHEPRVRVGRAGYRVFEVALRRASFRSCGRT